MSCSRTTSLIHSDVLQYALNPIKRVYDLDCYNFMRVLYIARPNQYGQIVDPQH